MNRLFILLLIILFSSTLYAQIDVQKIETSDATILNNLAQHYYTLGEYSKALEYATKIMNLEKESYGEYHPKYATSLNNLALIYSALGDYSKALDYSLKVMNIDRVALGENHPDYATALHNLALHYSSLGHYTKAMEYGKKALVIRRSVLGENHPHYALALVNLADYHYHLGNYTNAIEYATEAMNIFDLSLGRKHPYYITSLSNLSLYYYEIGDYSKAIGYGIKALELRKDLFGEHHPSYIISLNNIALYYYKLGDYIRAIEYAIKAEELSDKNHPIYANILNTLAGCYSKYGDYIKAVDCETKVIKIRQNTLGECNPEYAMSLNNLSYYYDELGNYTDAIKYEMIALQIFKSAYNENHPHYAMSLSNLAGYFSDLGDYVNAIYYICQSLSIDNYNIIQQLNGLPTSQRSSYWNKHSYSFTDYFPFLSFKNQRQKASELYDLSALFAKGLLLTTEMEMNRLIQESGDEEALEMFEELRFQKLQLHKIYETPLSERNLDADSLAQVVDQLERKLVERSKVYGDFTKKIRTTWQDVQMSLADDEIAVEFLSFHVFNTDSTMLAALTLRKDDAEPKFIPLFEIKQLSDVSDTEHFLCPEVADLVWKPIQNELKGIRRIYFSPAGVLHKIEIEYLPGMENYEMYRLSTTREIIDRKTDTTPSNIDNIKAVLYGGVDYEKAVVSTANPSSNTISEVVSGEISQELALSLHRSFVDSLDVRGMTADYLPSTLTEVQNIGKSLKKANCPTIVHVGTDATETSVKALSGNAPTILHISTHGFYFTDKQAKREDRPRFLGLEDERRANVEDKTLTRSGLLMAGANRSLKGEDVPMDADDGILTAQEISRLDLRGTKLVVLSACETGKGDIIQGEGVFGLQRGFKKAGVQTILMSLWKVSDIPTEMLMTEFYKNICEGKSKRGSLHMAQQKVREYQDSEGNYIFKDPHYWAGFVMLD